MNGLFMFTQTNCAFVTPLVCSCRSLAIFSVSPAFFAILYCMTGAYVSCKNGMPINEAAPQSAAIATKTNLISAYCAMKPPATGPTAGPGIVDRVTKQVCTRQDVPDTERT